MKSRENIAQILSDIISDNPNYDTLELVEAMYKIGFYDGVNSEKEHNMKVESELPPYYGN